jgi:MoaA/NifB/PqqE/SkfB family radical SAM enzyme
MKKEEKGKEEKDLLLFVGPTCNNRCIFCSVQNSHLNQNIGDASTADLKKQIYKNKDDFNYVSFIGGEFIIREDSLYLASLASDLGYKITLETNGRKLADKGFCDSMLANNFSALSVSIHGAYKETHDKITGAKNSFNESFQGLKNVTKNKNRPKKVIINFVINKFNYKEIPDFLDETINDQHLNEIDLINLVYIKSTELKALNEEQLKKIVPTFTEATPYLKKASYSHGINYQYIPPCILRNDDYIVNISNQKEKKNTSKDRFSDDPNVSEDLYSAFIKEQTKLESCKRCKEYENCSGIQTGYLKLYGDSEFIPIE